MEEVFGVGYAGEEGGGDGGEEEEFGDGGGGEAGGLHGWLWGCGGFQLGERRVERVEEGVRRPCGGMGGLVAFLLLSKNRRVDGEIECMFKHKVE